jgi:nitrate/TMAO reductase-like tetraheme cytochrome c subunit
VIGISAPRVVADRGVNVGEDERMDGQDARGPEPGEVPVEAGGGEAPAEPGALVGAAAEPAAPPDAAAEPGAPAPEGAPAEKTPPGKPRKKRRRRWVMALSIVAGVIVILIIAAFVTAHYTSASSFCDTCHEMDPYYTSWQHSTHASAECRDCHIPPGFIPYIETKLGSFREIWVHISGKPEAPLAVTREIPNSSCLRCHSDPPQDPSLPTVTFSHAGHAGIDCISCHVRLVHRTVNPPEYVDPAAMSSCLECHNGSIAPDNCSYCHTAPHEARGECSSCHTQAGWTPTTEDGTTETTTPATGTTGTTAPAGGTTGG